MCAASVFGYYDSDDFIDFLIHSNQFRARLNALGFKLEANNVHVTAGFRNPTAGKIFNNIYSSTSYEQNNYETVNFIPKVIAAIGYKIPNIFGIGLGYEFSYNSSEYQVHSPIITSVAYNDNFRISIPVHIGIGSKNKDGQIGISTAIEARYYLNLPFMSNIRLYIKYGEFNEKGKLGSTFQNSKKSSIGLATRIYFRVETEDVLIEPIIRLQYDQALESDVDGVKSFGNYYDITAFNQGKYSTGLDYKDNPTDDLGLIFRQGWAIENPYRIGVALPVGFTAGNDYFSVYLEPSVSFNVINGSRIYKSNQNNSDLVTLRPDAFYIVGYFVYGEFYLKPSKSLEWYTEIQTGGTSTLASLQKSSFSEFVLNASTGITWYFNL
ncbi:cell surface protein [Brachyspira hampsonii]|uniref:cell surface protein n=1 Tax=Brachyspira hampsonii TaxID=1287055 RepID=UPI0027E45634|nr:cell surface protein [Brachyspira hampsonii]